MGAAVVVASVGARDVAAWAVAPLAADLMIRCGPVDEPAAVVAATPTVAGERSGPARMLRDFLDEDPWAGTGSVRPGGWLVLAHAEDLMVFGQDLAGAPDRRCTHVEVLESLDEGAFPGDLRTGPGPASNAAGDVGGYGSVVVGHVRPTRAVG